MGRPRAAVPVACGDGKLIVDSRAVTLVDSAGTHVIPLTSVSPLHHGYVRPLAPAI